jgi:hypothetical protein
MEEFVVIISRRETLEMLPQDIPGLLAERKRNKIIKNR